MRYANANESERKILAEAIELAYPQTSSQILQELVSSMNKGSGGSGTASGTVLKDLGSMIPGFEE